MKISINSVEGQETISGGVGGGEWRESPFYPDALC